jgi:hypothetical protein
MENSWMFWRVCCVPATVVAVLLIVPVQVFLNTLLYQDDNQLYNIDLFHNTNDDNITATHLRIQGQILQLQRQISQLEDHQPPFYIQDDRFFPFVIRDARHLVPTQTSHNFHIFDYVDTTSPQQAKTRHSQLYYNAKPLQKAPCQKYSVECYRLKILQVFRHVLDNFPSARYYFYMEADNDLCVPMKMVQDLALGEERYFINVGIGFSGWIMSRQFVTDFYALYSNITIPTMGEQQAKNEPVPEMPEVRPDVLASYYLTEKHAWTVTRQYWVSHTTLESLGVSSLTVKDRRRKDSGQRLKLDKHLPRCFEPRRGKWMISQRKPPFDPRDRFGWDYFDYDVCPNAVIFPCEGPNQLAELVAKDWATANRTGAIAKQERLERARQEKEQRKREEEAQAAAGTSDKVNAGEGNALVAGADKHGPGQPQHQNNPLGNLLMNAKMEERQKRVAARRQQLIHDREEKQKAQHVIDG